MHISVVIPTYNRPDQIIACVESIFRSRTLCEILIVEQSKKTISSDTLRQWAARDVRYFFLQTPGVSRAKNYGIRKSRGDIVAFTDDDCIVDQAWVRAIQSVFRKENQITGVFGRTLPYNPGVHVNKECPSVFDSSVAVTIKRPVYHAEHIGFGNNMAFRKKFFEKHGYFKEWLGSGTAGSNAEDGELAMRALCSGQSLRYEPGVIVYHNRWLSRREMRRVHGSYVRGEMACYSYYLDTKLGREIVRGNMFASAKGLLRAFRSRRSEVWNEEARLLNARILGFIVGSMHYLLRCVSMSQRL